MEGSTEVGGNVRRKMVESKVKRSHICWGWMITVFLSLALSIYYIFKSVLRAICVKEDWFVFKLN